MPASAFSLYCEPVDISLALTGDSNFDGTCKEYGKINDGVCYPFKFYYQPTDEYGRKEFGVKTDFKLLSATPYEYNFQEVGKTGFDNDASASFISELKIDRRTLEYQYQHGVAGDYGTYLFFEDGQCELIEEEIEKPKI